MAQTYPAYFYAKGGKTALVQNEAEHQALEGEWHDTPAKIIEDPAESSGDDADQTDETSDSIDDPGDQTGEGQKNTDSGKKKTKSSGRSIGADESFGAGRPTTML